MAQVQGKSTAIYADATNAMFKFTLGNRQPHATAGVQVQVFDLWSNPLTFHTGEATRPEYKTSWTVGGGDSRSDSWSTRVDNVATAGKVVITHW
jgi:hypothetical protein